MVKNILHDCGIDDCFTGLSTRHASISSTTSKGLDYDTIRNSVEWSAE